MATSTIKQGTIKYEHVTLTAGTGIVITSQECYIYGKLLFVSMVWTAESNITPYATIASFGYSSKISWSAPLTSTDSAVIANKGLYADKNNRMIRAANTIPAGNYKTFLVIPIE